MTPPPSEQVCARCGLVGEDRMWCDKRDCQEQEIPTPRTPFAEVAYSNWNGMNVKVLASDALRLANGTKLYTEFDIAAIERELARLRSALADERARAERAEQSLREGMKDAERYRWLRDQLTWSVDPGATGMRWSVHFECAYGRSEDEDSLDAAIDAALPGEKA